MPSYVVYPLDSNPETIFAEAVALLQLRFPGWQPNDANIDTAMLEAFAAGNADLRDIASQVTEAVFRRLGSSLIGLTPIDATVATVPSTWVLSDNLGHTIPAGTQVGIRNSAGELIPFTVLSNVTVAPGSTTTASGAVTLAAVTAGASGTGLGGPVELIDPLIWVTSIVTTVASSGGQDAETDDDYLDRLRTYLTLLTPTPVLPDDFALLARQIPGVWRASAIDGYNPVHNLLTADEASFETGVSHYFGTNAVLAQSNAQFLDGANSMRLTASSAADMYAELTAGNGKAVVAGQEVAVLASFRAATTGRNCRVGVQWLDFGGGSLGYSYGTTVADSNSGWTQAVFLGQAPELAVTAFVILYVFAPANGEQHYVDKVQFRRGEYLTAPTDWVAGGTAATGNARSITVVAVDSSGNGVDSGTKSAVDAYLQSLRETNFLINVVDPAQTLIDVAVTVKVRDGFTPSSVAAAVASAIRAYLDPATWGAPSGDLHSWGSAPVVRYLEMATVVNGVNGVDYITTTAGTTYDLTMEIHSFTPARTDIALPGIAPLPKANTVTVTTV